MKKLLLGIDLGTTVLKAAAFDAGTGKFAGGVSTRLSIETGADGRREQQPDALLRALRRAIAALGKQAGSLDAVCGVGLAAQGGSMIIVERASGKALTPMTLWNDTRAFPEFQEIAARHPPRFWRGFSLRDEPGMGLARLARMRREAPALLCASNLYAGAGEFVFHHLTGEWRQDAGNALQTGCYDAKRETLSERGARIVGMPLSFFAPMRKGHETCPLSGAASRRFGLPAGIPVAGPYMDHEAGYLAASQVTRNPLQCSLGTAWVGNFVVPANSTGGSPFQLVLPSPLGEGRLVVQPLLTGNVTWDWALECFAGKNPARALKKQADIFREALLPAPGLIALPWLNRPNPFAAALNGACSLLGAGPSTTPSDLLRAVAAGMCFELHRVFEEATSRGMFGGLVLGGGASKARQFQHLIAALFAPLPVYRVLDEDWTGARGTLHLFSSRVCRAKAERVIVPKSLDDGKLQQARGLYEAAFDLLLGDIPAGRACHFGKLPEEKP